MKKSISKRTKTFSRQLRNQATPAERKLWSMIRNGQLYDLHVRRQYPIGTYIADFYIPALRLVIELDGNSHDFRVDQDDIREKFIHGQGIDIVRIQSQRIFQEPDFVYDYLDTICRKRLGEQFLD